VIKSYNQILQMFYYPPDAALVDGARPRACPAGGALLAVVDLPVVVVCVGACPGGSHSLSDNASFRLASQPVHPTYLQNRQYQQLMLFLWV